MNMKTFSLTFTVFLLSFLTLNSIEVKAQYMPVGPQTNVPVSTVTGGGWTECYKDTYNNIPDSDVVLSNCPGDLLMLACRPTGSDTLTLLAQGERSDVTFDTGDNDNVTHIANGVGWYFNKDTPSWGFVRAGDSVEKVPCDVDNSGANDQRLCWHIVPDAQGGYRCGVTEALNFSDEYERIVYMASAPPPPTPASIPTLSEWGLVAMAGILGIIGLMIIKRRKLRA